METTIEDDYKKPHWELDPVTGKIKYNETNAHLRNHMRLPNYGSPIRPGVAKKLIDNYQKKKTDEWPLYFTFGRNGLEAILNQHGCGGIRFYLAKKDISDLCDDDKKNEGIKKIWQVGYTLVAIGVGPENISKRRTIGDDPDLGFDTHITNLQTNEDQPHYQVLNRMGNFESDSIIIEVLPHNPK